MLPTTRQIATATLLHRSNSRVAACMVHARQTKEMMVACAATQMYTRQEKPPSTAADYQTKPHPPGTETPKN